MSDRSENYAEILEILEQVIYLMENSSIQVVKGIISDSDSQKMIDSVVGEDAGSDAGSDATADFA